MVHHFEFHGKISETNLCNILDCEDLGTRHQKVNSFLKEH